MGSGRKEKEEHMEIAPATPTCKWKANPSGDLSSHLQATPHAPSCAAMLCREAMRAQDGQCKWKIEEGKQG